MTSTGSSKAPRQERSRRTAERLLAATVRLLDASGLEGAVIPRIATAAGVSPASVYRRFADKDELLRAAFLHLLRQSYEANQRTLSTILLRATLAASANRLMIVLFQQYRHHPRLLRALSRFIDDDTDQAFVREARSLMSDSVNAMVRVLLAHRKEIAHADPERALQIAILNAACSIEVFALDPNSLWHVGATITDEELAQELARGFVAYLQNSPITSGKFKATRRGSRLVP